MENDVYFLIIWCNLYKKNCYENKWVFYFVFKYNDDNYWNKNF